MATAAQRRAFGNFQVSAVAGLKQFQVGFVATIEAVVIAMVPAVGHDDVIMLLGHNHIPFGIEL